MSLPRVTDVLKMAGMMDLAWCTEEDRERGTLVHRLCELHDRTIEMEVVLDDIAGKKYQYYLNFLEDVKPKIRAIEQEVEKPGIYAGRLDRVMEINGVTGVLDIKSGALYPYVPIQLAAYALTFYKKMARWGLSLSGTGERGYKLVDYTENAYEHDKTWWSAYDVARFRRENGLCKK